MSYSNEIAMYPDLVRWFGIYLQSAYPRASVIVYDTHSKPLNEFIRIHHLQSHFQDTYWETYEINVDVTGFVSLNGGGYLAFIEAKIGELKLYDLSQLIGYSRVANPIAAYLLSPQSMSAPLHSLLVSKGRSDILIYYQNKRETRNIVVGRWNEQTQEVDPASKIPAGSLAMIEANL